MRLFKKKAKSPVDRIPPTQLKNIGLPPSYLKVYLFVSNRPSASHEMIQKATGYTRNHVKQIIFGLRNKHRAIRRVTGYVICDLRIGKLATKWKNSLKDVIPQKDYHVFFNEDGTRKINDAHSALPSQASRNLFLTELISGEILKYLLAGGKPKMKPWEYWDFAKKLGCGMKTVHRPNEEIIKKTIRYQDELRPGSLEGIGEIVS